MQKTQLNILSNGTKFGTVIAITISWSLHKSILWAILHGMCSWFYIIFYVVTRG